MFELPTGKVTSTMLKIQITNSTTCYLNINNVVENLAIPFSTFQQMVVRSKPANITLEITGLDSMGEYTTLDKFTLPNYDMMVKISEIYYPYQNERVNVSYVTATFEMRDNRETTE
jgi:hypothetical protein